MFLKLPAIEIGATTFDDIDLLGRAELAHRLTETVDRIQDPLVLALDDDWGTGKSVFLKLWVGEHAKRSGESRLIYFDAFAHDFLDDPLASLVVRLRQECANDSGPVKKAMSGIMNAAKKVALPAARTIAAVASAGVSEIGASAGQALANEIEPTLEKFWNNENARIDAISEFRDSLRDLARERKIVCIIDELDRCRPDYSLGMLEIVKHFFNVENVHFVLGVNLEVLRNSIILRYGSGLDPDLYLQKFLTATFSFSDTLGGEVGKRYMIKMLENKDVVAKLRLGSYLVDEVMVALSIPSVRRKVSLRSIERIFTRLCFISSELNKRPHSERLLIGFLAAIETSNPKMYERIRTGSATEDEVREFLFAGNVKQDKELISYLYHIILICLGKEPEPEIRKSLRNEYFNYAVGDDWREYFSRRLTQTLDTFHLTMPK